MGNSNELLRMEVGLTMSILKVNEIFLSIQGEGARAGTVNIFIRLSGCDLTCGFCDTEFEGGKEMTVDEVLKECKKYSPVKNIIWTGGEPSLQLTDEIVDFFNEKGYYQAIETNGNNRVPKNLAWITISPKVAEHVIERNFGNREVDELRYAYYSHKKSVPQPKIKAKHLYLSPIFNGNQIDKENLKTCLQLIKENPEWKLSIQLHKLLNLP